MTSHALIEVCPDCLGQATERLVLLVLVMQACWVTSDIGAMRYDGSQQDWHEPLNLASVMNGHSLLCSPN